MTARAELVEQRHVLLCCGTGGVGKTTTAATLAIEGARRGRNAVVVTIDPAKRLANTLGLEHLSNSAHEIERAVWDPDGDALPGGRLHALMLDTETTFDQLVQTYARNDEQAADVVALLSDPARCQVMLVTLPEETPVSEAIETAFAIEDRAGVALGPIVVNQCVPPLDLDGDVEADAAVTGLAIDASERDALMAASTFRADLFRRQDEQCARLAERLPLPQLRLPYFFTADVGPTEIELLADELVLGIGAVL